MRNVLSMLTNTAGRGTEMKTTLVCLKAVLKETVT